jgi:hypothetical protein
MALEVENLQLRSALTAIRDRLWTDGESYDERIGDLKWLATEASKLYYPKYYREALRPVIRKIIACVDGER